MGIIGWIILGGLAGWLGSLLMKEEQGCLMNVVVGVVGGIVGGLLFSLAGGAGITGFNIWSLVVAIVGSVVFLAVLRWLRGDRSKTGGRRRDRDR
jgi:uncharacterized membrane protein YeaQ/YmgE (transglycosylase-associated protein family)